ncbi:hypothetical protein ACQ7CX_09520 [Chryseobacterium arthrosphaerae]|uniref:hypothetical protein n=1 Tax=Chryseobacterium arthrosphaerae TaxID=651561 RepID=UPI001BAF1B9B|nr:hypothetical protein [Chryseobacterium arthrosphaerae]QUY56328.1 hypothetical protein I2F65_02965 [Chryseobacterium arthrosphaerae]
MNTLERSVEQLYEIFSGYPLVPRMNGCPCCVSGTDKEKLHIRPLRDLEENDLLRYVFKALTTWGSIEDFKHFLPRLFEILAKGGFIAYLDTILGKLEYGKFVMWPENEKAAVKTFLWQWWQNRLATQSYFDHEAFCGIYKITGELDRMLECWETDFQTNGFRVFVDYIDHYYLDMIYDGKNFRDFKRDDIKRINSWIAKNKDNLEKGFFYFENRETEFTEIISNALFTVEKNYKNLK